MVITKENIKLTIAMNILKFRKAKALSQTSLAEILGTTNSYLSQIENGHISVSMDMLSKLCNALDVVPFEFYLPDHQPLENKTTENQ